VLVTEARPDGPATPREPKSPSTTPPCEPAESDQWAFMTALPPRARLFLAVGDVPSEVSHALKRCSSICLSCARSVDYIIEAVRPDSRNTRPSATQRPPRAARPVADSSKGHGSWMN
jgi:hypothetical protein